MATQNMVYSYNGVLLSYKNEVLINATKCTNLKNFILSDGSWTHKITYCMIDSIDVKYPGQVIP